ncbi:hypothetical protein EKO04_010746 [Ascochyta lentis]|uniref:Uncharacterized protein n=1 Tax=Ascochyta lentis TaxID=205686 RepID=A0A8H7IUR9_9PLEO|nr:hypothetical protein EKO04_010746 [Ascochyta lentis]
MPLPDKLKSTVWSAVHQIEKSMDIHYPRSFPTIEDVKSYIDTVCAERNFDYHLRADYNLRQQDPHYIVRIVKDRVCYLVAARAHGQGEFYLEEPLPNRKILRGAVEADIARANLLITKWPTEFFDADVAAKYVAGVCALNKFEYTPFGGVAAEKFQGYVTFNTARHAFAAGMFELKVVRKDWVRKEKKQGQTSKQGLMQEEGATRLGLKTLEDAVELDVHRVSNLIPRSFWPTTFIDVNEARNFVSNYCYETRFRYTGWPGVAPDRFQLFVNYNTAKSAFRDGIFKVEKKTPEKKPLKKMLDEEESGGVANKSAVKVVDVLASTSETTTNKLGHSDAGDCIKGVDAADIDTFDDDYELNSAGSFLSSEMSDPPTIGELSNEEVGKDSAEPEEAVAVDPFKDLVAELQRGYLLKAAFA